jgi:hypothetical protein
MRLTWIVSCTIRIGLLAGLTCGFAATSARAQTTFGPGAAMNLSDGNVHTSTISVGTAGAVTSVSVELDGVASSGSCNVCQGLVATWFILKSPTGQELVLMGDSGVFDDFTGLTITYSDSATHPTAIEDPPLAASWTLVSGYPTVTVKPDSFWNNQGGAPASPGFPDGQPYPDATPVTDSPLTDGSATFFSQFNGVASAGTWTLIAEDDCNAIFSADGPGCNSSDNNSITGWKLTLGISETLESTTTTLSTSANPANKASGAVTFTATVSSASTVNMGTVTFTASVPDVNGNLQTTALCGGQPVSNGEAACNTTLTTQGINSINASYSEGTHFGGSSTTAPLNELVEPRPSSITTSGNKWCNTAQIVVPGSFGSGPPSLYPSIVPVTGVSQSVADVTVSLEGVSAALTVFDGMDFLLVGPSGGTYNLDFLSKAFSGAAFSGLNFTIEDGAGQTATEATTATSGNWDPSNNGSFVAAPFFPSSTAPTIDSVIPQVPGTIALAQPIGASTNTLQHSFNGSVANGDWSLYIMNDNGTGAGDGLTMASGWCVDFTLNSGVATTTTLSTSANPATTGTQVTFTATVTTSGNPVSSGTVTFEDNGATPAGTVGGNNVVSLNGSGQATFVTSSLSEGDHPITASFSGTEDDDVSSSAPLVQRIDDATGVTTVNGNTWQFCNTGAITLPGAQPPNNTGPASPNPSNIFVAGVPGTLSGVNLTLKNFSAPNLQNVQLESLLVGPGNSSGPALDFFSYTGGGEETTPPATGSYEFLDGGAAMPSNADIAPGNYEASSYHNSADTFFASTSGLYTPPSTFDYAQTRGSATFASTFTNANPSDSLNPNGTWSLYFNENIFTDVISSPANGWCLQLTENLPTVSVSTESADTFTQGQQNAPLTINIDNNGSTGPTGDPTSGSNPMTVTDTLNSAFTFASGSGTGWTCSAPVPPTVTCTNDSAIAQGSSYPALTIYVNVGSASGNVSNSASVSGAGVSTTNSNSDTITINPVPVNIAAAFSPPSIAAGGTSSLSITLASPAAFSQSGVAFSDTLPTGMTVASVANLTNDGCGGTAAAISGGTTLSLSSGSLAANTSCTVSVNVTSATPGLATDTTGAVSSTPGGTGLTASANLAIGDITPGITLSPIPAMLNRGTPTTLTATFTTIAGAPAPTANMNFYAGATLLGPAALGSYNPATYTYTATGTFSNLPVGTQNIVATYPGDGSYLTNSSTGQSTYVIANDLWIGDSNNTTAAFSATGVPYPLSPELGSGSGGVAIDGSGNVWSLNTGSSSVTEFTSKGTVTNGPYTDGGLSTPSALAIDGLDQVWIVNSTNSISVFNSSGTAISTTDYTGGGLSSPTSVAIDISGNLWIVNSNGNSVTKVLGVAAPTIPLATGVANNTPATEP